MRANQVATSRSDQSSPCSHAEMDEEEEEAGLLLPRWHTKGPPIRLKAEILNATIEVTDVLSSNTQVMGLTHQMEVFFDLIPLSNQTLALKTQLSAF